MDPNRAGMSSLPSLRSLNLHLDNEPPPASSATVTRTPSIRTRSMSRKNLSSSRSSSSLPPPSSSAPPRPSSSALPPSSSSRALGSHLPPRSATASRTLSSLAKAGPSRRILNETSNASTAASDLGILTEEGAPPSTVKRVGGATKYGGAAVAVVPGMGVVRMGPRVVSPRQRSPVKAPPAALFAPPKLRASDDPFSLSFEPPEWARASTSKSSKRPFESTSSDEEGSDDGDDGDEPTAKFGDVPQRREGGTGGSRSIKPSPTKRAFYERVPSSVGEGVEAGQPRLFDLTSPKKASSSHARRQLSPRLQFLQDAPADSNDLLFPPSTVVTASSPSAASHMDVDRERIPSSAPPSSSPFPPQRTKKQPREDDSSEDEIDFLSPRKKQRPDGFGLAPPPATSTAPASGSVRRDGAKSPSASSIRSPPRRKPTSTLGLVPPVSARRAASVPMERQTYVLPTSQPRATSSSSSASINPQLLGGGSGSSASPSPFNSAFTYGGLPSSSTYYSSAVSARCPIPTAPATTWRSGIPRLAQPVPQPQPQPQLPAPAPSNSSVRKELTSQAPTSSAGDASLSSSGGAGQGDVSTFSIFSRGDTTDGDGDVSMALPCAPDTSMTSSSSVQGRVGDETAKRLANLQAMLSRLAMPRQQVAAASTFKQAAAALTSKDAGGALKPRAKSGTVTATSSSRAGGLPSTSAVLSGSKSYAPLPTRSAATSAATPAASTSSSAAAPRRRIATGTAAFRTEYSVPLAPADNSQPSAAPSRARPSLSTSASTSHLPRRQSASTRPSTTHASLSASTSLSSSTTTSRRTSVLPQSTSTAAIDAAAHHEGEVSARPQSNVLKGVIAFVDVRTGDGDDAGMIFVDMLKSMGARVTTRPTLTLTHIIYKSGRPGTLHRYRAHPDPKPHLVGISWVVRCAEIGARVDEKSYIVESGKEAVFQKRRRSMEPKALASLNASVNGGSATTDPALKATIAASIERARRKSLQFAPKIGSPLAKRVWVMPESTEEDED